MGDQGSPSKGQRPSILPGGRASSGSKTSNSPQKVRGKSKDSRKGIPKGRTDRTISTLSISDDTSSFNSLLSPQVKELLIKFKKTHGVKDPFSKDNQGIIDEFIRVTNTVQKQVEEGNLAQINLTEAALLLDCSMRTFSKQVQNTKDHVRRLAEYATTSRKPAPEPEYAEDDNEGPPESENVADPSETAANVSTDAQNIGETGPESTNIETGKESPEKATDEQSDSSARVNADSEMTAAGESIHNDTDSESTRQSVTVEPEVPAVRKEADVITIMDDDVEEVEKQVNEEISDAPVQNHDETAGEALEPKEKAAREKRQKRDYGEPPVLVPWYDVPICPRLEDSDDDCPPDLVSCLRKQRVVKEKTAEELKKLKEKPKRDSTTKDTEDKSSDASLPAVPGVTPETPEVPAPISMEGVVIKVEKEDDSYGDRVVPIGVSLPDFLSKGDLNRDLAGFSQEEQTEIQKFINQLHYLPFTCELTKEEVEKTFEHAVSRLENIYKEHNIPYSRHISKVASEACAQISENYAKWLDLDKNPAASSSELHETFSQTLKQPTDDASQSSVPEDDDDSELTIMERTAEKTKVQSEKRMREMLLEIQKSIVPKYTQIPLIEENTEGFFRRVKSFELKMKKVLADEEKKEEFDVRKYEMDVLDVTNKESQEQSEETRITSPTLKLDNPDLAVDYNLLGFQFDGLPSPSSSSEGGDGHRWIPLRQVFSHMKKLDRPEAARMFYAVLALLSFQNLDIKYDNHYSAESAALTANNLDHRIDSKYPRGVKIMTSRCADVDKEEVYIAALSSKSRTETFRELEALHREADAKEHQHREQFENHPHLNGLRLDHVINGDLTVDINEHFTHGECMEYPGFKTPPPKKTRKRKRGRSSDASPKPRPSTSFCLTPSDGPRASTEGQKSPKYS